MTQTRDKAALAAFLRRDAALHLYELGDLDPFFFPHCTWHTLEDGGSIRAVVLEYACPLLHTVLALGRDDDGAIADLFARALPTLPARFYAHLSPGLEPLLGERPRTAHGTHLKMTLADRRALEDACVDGVTALAPTDLPELCAFYAQAYPDNWFDPRMLETGRYFGLRDDGHLIAVAGVHVHSSTMSVAALGNIATHSNHRGRGLARRVTARLCRELHDITTIGLNVAADNTAAIACYRHLGFVQSATYEEWLIASPDA